MKLLISSDIEGTCGIAAWDETYIEKESFWTAYFQEQMTKEATAACEGALAAGFTQVLVRDAHDSARNILPAKLPRETEIIQGWTGDGWSMAAGLQDGVDALACTGFHAWANSGASPLAHTLHPTDVEVLTINGREASEFTVFSYAAAMLGIPVVFISGDEAVCAQAKELIPQITTVPVLKGWGSATVSPHPDLACAAIRSGMEQALTGDWRACSMPLPQEFDITVRYTSHARAFSAAFYPSAEQTDIRTVRFHTGDYLDALRFFHFCI